MNHQSLPLSSLALFQVFVPSSSGPSSEPTSSPTTSMRRSLNPTAALSRQPSNVPSSTPSAFTSKMPSEALSRRSSWEPSSIPSDGSSHLPSSSPSENSVTSIQVIDLILVDPVTNEDILGAFDCLPYICNNDVVLVNICAETIGHVKSVCLSLIGPVSVQPPRVENVAPWSPFRDVNGDFNHAVLQPVKYTISAKQFSEMNSQGKAGEIMSLQFQVPPSEVGAPEEQNGPLTKPSRAPSSNPSDSPSLRPSSAISSTFPLGTKLQSHSRANRYCPLMDILFGTRVTVLRTEHASI